MAMLRESSLGKTILVLSLFLGPVGRRHVCSVAWRSHGLRIISSIVRNRDEVFGWFGTDRRGCSKRSGTLFRNVFRNKTEIFTALRGEGRAPAGHFSGRWACDFWADTWCNAGAISLSTGRSKSVGTWVKKWNDVRRGGGHGAMVPVFQYTPHAAFSMDPVLHTDPHCPLAEGKGKNRTSRRSPVC